VRLSSTASLGGALAEDGDRGKNGDEPRTRTPIKHLIYILGENRSFDNVFGVYQPRHGQTIAKLLSKGIVNVDGPRIPLIVVSPFATGGKVVHSYSDQASVLKFIERNWRLEPLSERSRDNLPNPESEATIPTSRGTRRRSATSSTCSISTAIATAITMIMATTIDAVSSDDRKGRQGRGKSAAFSEFPLLAGEGGAHAAKPHGRVRGRAAPA
jgi:hypothetical protein